MTEANSTESVQLRHDMCTTDRAYVKDLDMLVTVQLLEDTPTV